MRIGLVQQVVGSIGGNDKVLDAFFECFKDHELHLFSFSKITKTLPDNIIPHVKVPVHVPFLGVYQKLLMSQHDYSKCDVVFSTTGYPVKTDKRLIIYDQNNLSNEFNKVIPEKYKRGLWRLYYLPFMRFNRPKTVKGATYVANSKFTRRILRGATGMGDIGLVYPPVNLDEFYILPKKPQICVVGRISPEKNLERAVRILNKVGVQSIIFGNVTRTNQSYLEKLKSMANDNVAFIVSQPRDKLLHLMAESKIIFTASEETFGITTVEGIASGCIPIVPDNSAHPEVVPDRTLRYQTDVEAVETIQRVINDDFYDMRLLTDNIKKFSPENFNSSFTELIK